MRTYSFFSIFLLCILILIIDALAFYWLQSITALLNSEKLRTLIHTLFWLFTFGLVTAILILKLRINAIAPRWKHRLVSSMYGLTVSSFVPKLLFVLVISLLYYSTLSLPSTKIVIWISVFGLIAGFLPFFIIVYAIFGALYRFKVREHRLQCADLPHSFDGLRLVHISDLHLGSFEYRFKTLGKAITMINTLQPDLILFTGDLVNNYAWELRGWDKVLSQLKASVGKYAILGNHDYGDYSEWETQQEKEKNFQEIQDFYKVSGFRLLLNEHAIIKRNGDAVAILGVENWGKPPFKKYGDLKAAMNGVEGVSFKILLSHDPSHWEAEVLEKTDIQLTLSGHTHGMQAAVIMGNKQWSPIQLKYKHWAGLYRKGDQMLYVNRGLGWMGFPGRIGVRPEITFIDLVR